MRNIFIALFSFILGGLVVGYLIFSERQSPLYKYGLTSERHWMPDRWDRKLVVDDCVRLAEAHQESLAIRRQYFEVCMSENDFKWKNEKNE